jgi:hypothetical protein
MAEWQILEWDLATPVREELKAQGYYPEIIDVGGTPAVSPKKMKLKTLGRLVDPRLPREGAPVRVERAEAQFMWVDVRVSIGEEEGLSLEAIESIANDPLLHQRLFDAVQAPFRQACKRIAYHIKIYDIHMAKPQNRSAPGQLDRHPKTIELVNKIRTELTGAQRTGAQNLAAVQTNLTVELAGKQTTKKKIKVGFKIFLGVAAVVCCVVATVATWGVAGGLLAGAAIVAGGRALIDTSKALNDQLVGADTVRKRLMKAVELFQKSNSMNGAKRTAEAIANSMIKAGAIGYNLLGIGKFASLSDVAEDVDLYDEKLCTIRASAHELSRKVNDRLKEMDGLRNAQKVPKAFRSTKKIKIVPNASAVAREAWKGKTVTRSKKELELHNLLTKIPKFHQACDAHLKALPGLKEAVRQVIESKGAKFMLLEKWLDFSANVFLTTVGTVGGIATWGGWSDTFTVLGTADDVVSELDQGISAGQSSRYESEHGRPRR